MAFGMASRSIEQRAEHGLLHVHGLGRHPACLLAEGDDVRLPPPARHLRERDLGRVVVDPERSLLEVVLFSHVVGRAGALRSAAAGRVY